MDAERLASGTPTGHHGLAAHEVVLLLESDPRRGLTAAEAAGRLTRFGPNRLPAARRAGLAVRVLRQFRNPLVVVLLVAAAIDVALGEVVDPLVILGVVLINAVVGFVQESRAEAALEGLRSLLQTDAEVVRDGRRERLPGDRLVPGDLVLLDAGDRVPADLRLLASTGLAVDESALTGESVPVVKDGALVLADPVPLAERGNMAYSGTLVTAGGGAGIVVATGTGTELGEIHRLVGAAEDLATPLTRKLARFSTLVTVVILALAAVTFAIGLLRGQAPTTMFTAAIALAVGAIPEGLPAVVTITLAIGTARMARRRAVIRRLPAVETLGGTTVICSDKTGTLTENRMTVRAVWTPNGQYEVAAPGDEAAGTLTTADGSAARLEADLALRWCLVAGVACNDAALVAAGGRRDVVGDPTEGAMLVVAGAAGLDVDDVRAALPREATVPFDSDRQYMATLHRDERGAGVLLVKGAVERVLGTCTAQLAADGRRAPLDPAAVLHAADLLAGRGLRVLATAMRPADDAEVEGLALTGLQAMADPPRAGAARSVAACATAGIAVKMITGDRAATARSVAAQIGLVGPDETDAVVVGDAIDGLDDAALAAVAERAAVFARITPAQKLRLVQALQSRGQVVAMTGDGVNDAPALQQADIGVAMGRGGTEVAKDAADMVLLDDDFSTIEAAVEEGRGVFDNLLKFIAWTLPTNAAEGLVILVAIVLGAALPILPTQILWLNMTTSVALGLMLAFEPKEAGIMRRPPRAPRQPLLTAPLLVRTALVAALLVAGAWWLFEWEVAHGAATAEARTAALNLFAVVEALYLFSCRSLTTSAWRIGLLGNPWILAGVGLQALAQAAITYLPALNAVFATAPIGAAAWLRILAVGVAVSVVVAVDKRLRRW